MKLVEELLYENEGASLDFKQEQYLFENASDEEKGEILKDILSFANSWRRTDAYILIGVQEIKGSKSNVVGILHHVEEASLQQFVNSKTNRPVNFSYEALSFEGKQVGVIRIPVQERPTFLIRNFGKLQKDTVYIRRGSSSETAKPDEIAKMGAEALESKQSPVLNVQFGNNESRSILGKVLTLTSDYLLMPNKSEIPKVDDDRYGLPFSIWRTNENYYREFADYAFMTSLLKPISLVVFNTGVTLAANVRIQIIQPKIDNLKILDSADYPDKPEYSKGVDVVGLTGLNRSFESGVRTDVEDLGDKWEISIGMGNIQPGANSWSDIFYLAVLKQQNIKLKADVFADNLPKPMLIDLEISINVNQQSISLDDLKSLADANRDLE